ncbi:MAG TPA: hypothetical protein VMH39_15660, partial [Gemmatimonadaceae bacterium]|nr:hypothetical protein [Gemmatimonadaceae bacterium]
CAPRIVTTTGPNGSTIIDGQLNRWTGGRNQTAMDFINSQRRRLIYITAWQEYLKDVDFYIGAADTGLHAQTGHPVAVVQYAFSAGGGGRGGGGGGGGGFGGAGGAAGAGAPPATPPTVCPAYAGGPMLTTGQPQPRCTQIAGNLYNDDIILSVAHKYQTHTDWMKEHPKMVG